MSSNRVIPARRFYFLRHGQTDWNSQGRYQGTSDIPLNATGTAQAHAAAECLAFAKIDRIVASPLIRARKTAEIVAERHRVSIHTEAGLVERCFGSFEGLVIREVKERHGVPLDKPSSAILPRDADPWHEIYDRVPHIIARWLNAHPNDTLLFVAHGGVFDALHQYMIGPRVGPESKHAIPYVAQPLSSGWSLAPLNGDAEVPE